MRRREFSRTLAVLGTGAAFSSAGAASSAADPGSITDVQGVQVGHFTESRRPTGCTVLLFGEKGAIAGVDVRGSAPGTRETDLLNPVNTVQEVHAIVLSGGSSFGLDTASGVMRYLDERHIGFKVGNAVVPIVPAAILFDLGVGDSKIRPTAESGYKACQAATSGRVPEGNVGAGAGATIGKMFGMKQAMKSGLGSASIRVGNTGIVVGAIVAVNAVGDVLDPDTGKIIAGARKPDGSGFVDTMARIRQQYNNWCGGHQRRAQQDPGRESRADGPRRAGPHHQSGTFAHGWRHHFRRGHRGSHNACVARCDRRAGRRRDGARGAAGGHECARHRGATELCGSSGSPIASRPFPESQSYN